MNIATALANCSVETLCCMKLLLATIVLCCFHSSRTKVYFLRTNEFEMLQAKTTSEHDNIRRLEREGIRRYRRGKSHINALRQNSQ